MRLDEALLELAIEAALDERRPGPCPEDLAAALLASPLRPAPAPDPPAWSWADYAAALDPAALGVLMA